MNLNPLLRSGPAATVLALALGGLGLAACDSTATIYVSTPKFSQVQIIGAYPAKKQPDGSWERVCGTGPADGIITNVAFLSTQRRAGTTGAPTDSDISIRPGDVIDTRVVNGGLPGDVNLSSTGNLELQMSCINPASNVGSTCDTANGGATPSITLDKVTYHQNVPTRSTGHNVMLLIDQSGSVGGLVRDGIFKEERQPNPLPGNFGAVASDRTGLRLAAARRLLGILNPADRFGAMAFGESISLSVPCADAIGDVKTDLDNCFGSRNRDIWLSGIDALQGTTGGRSNLWNAVKTSYEYLRNTVADTTRSNHIVVITDGPDTCAGENRLTCATPCSTADYQALVDTVEGDHANPNTPKIHIHFVQFESQGYLGRDPRQVELACVSGGHYQFINSQSFSSAQPTSFQEALDLAVANVRFTLMGHWELAAQVPVYQSNAGSGAGVLPGNLYGLQGQLTVKGTSNMVLSDRQFPFGVGQGSGAATATTWDRRPTLRKPCGGFADCGAGSQPGACQVVCSPETMICANGASAVTQPDLASCDAAGFCCGGSCQTGGTCAACN
ncbi:MAG: VWA domain-containing protein [Deltaproteobacteria bacterium]|nr:VWA domain-containing protein [Deltaproteobacteria bacterium]